MPVIKCSIRKCKLIVRDSSRRPPPVMGFLSNQEELQPTLAPRGPKLYLDRPSAGSARFFFSFGKESPSSSTRAFSRVFTLMIHQLWIKEKAPLPI